MSDRVPDLLQFIDRSPTPYHAVAECVRRLGEAGFTPVAEDAVWSLEPGARRPGRGPAELTNGLLDDCYDRAACHEA